MNRNLRNAFREEMDSAKEYYRQAYYPACFRHLERAHILGQRYYLPHVESHWWMLKTGYRESNFKEMLGQLIRIIASFASLFGWVPTGNTGGTNVNALKPMPIPKDLEQYLKAERNVSAATAIIKVITTGLAIALVAYVF